MADTLAPGEPSVEDVPYPEILTSIVRRLIQLVGVPAVLNVARQVPRLRVNDEGDVLDYNRDDPLGTIAMFIEQYRLLFGENVVDLVQPATRPMARLTHDRNLEAIEARAATGVSPMRILVVDDQVIFRGGLVRLLGPQPDMEIVGEAGTMREAIAKARELRPDAILMDLGLPDGAGLGATLAILAEMPNTRIVFLTVHDDDEDLFAAIRAGAKGYLLKSVSAPELLARLRGVMRGEAAITPGLARRILEEFSRTPPGNHTDSSETNKLTARELDVIRALAQGATNREIAEQLVVSENTVRTHVHNALAKLHLHSRRDMAKYARTHGLIPASTDLNP